MKNDYITKALEEHGGFFAFSDKQFNEQKQEGVTYILLGVGLIVPSESAYVLIEAINNGSKESITKDLEENGKKKIIHRELANYEAHISGEIDDTVNALKSYGITEEDVRVEYKEYFNKCVELDLF